MPTISNVNIPTPRSWEEFEDITLSALSLRWKTVGLTKHGRQGQKQDGVDIYGDDISGQLCGIQCKNTTGGVDEKTIKSEIIKAEKFQPVIKSLYIATTAPSDVNIQKIVRELSNQRTKDGKFSVSILFWGDISKDIASDEAVFFNHYPQFKNHLEYKGINSDKLLFGELKKILPSQGSISFINENNMAGFAFKDTQLDQIRQFYYEWDIPEKEFISVELESLRKSLHTKIDQYLDIIATQTWTCESNLKFRTVPPEWEFEQPERFSRVVAQLHSLAGDIVEIHQQLFRKARELLES